MIKFPNIPNIIGQGVGKVLHIPVDFAKGIKKGFVGKKVDEHEIVEDVGEPCPNKTEPDSTEI